MGQCYAKPPGAGSARRRQNSRSGALKRQNSAPTTAASTPWPSPFPQSLPPGIPPSPKNSVPTTPRTQSRRRFPPPSPAKHIGGSFAKRSAPAKPREEPALQGGSSSGGGEGGSGGGGVVLEERVWLDKRFGYKKNFARRYEIGREIGRGHFGYTCEAVALAGEMEGETLAVKIIPKDKMTSTIAIEDVSREVKILEAFSGCSNIVKFYEAYEDSLNVYIVMELCEGGDLLDRLLSSGGRYTEEDTKTIVIQMLHAVAFSHLQGVVHRDLKPENFLFVNKDASASMKLIDFGLSDFVPPDERLSDIVGSAYYVAPEVLHKSYNTEADMWSIGVITYILLCGSRPFWARTESGIFRAVLKADFSFTDSSWLDISHEAKDLVKRLLTKDHRKRLTAVQALTHPWLREEQQQFPLDILIYKSVKFYLRASSFKRAALKALSKAITQDELLYIKSQFNLLEPDDDGFISLENFKRALLRNETSAMKESRVPETLSALEPLSFRKMDFEEFCAAVISPHQLEVSEGWERMATLAFEYFEEEGNRVISIEELAREMKLPPTSYAVVRDWLRPTDNKLTFFGFTKFLHGVTIRSVSTKLEH